MHICQFNSQQHPGTFWEKPSRAFPNASEVLHQGNLYTFNKGCLKPEAYLLTRYQLIKVSGLHMVEVGDVGWVTILPFEEYGKKQVRCGFTIKHSDEKIDFYADDQSSLDQWLRHLEKLAVLQDVKSDYIVGAIIGSGGQSVVRLGTSLETREQVVIKSYEKRTLQEKPKCYKALVNEITILRELSHPNIVKLYRVYESTLYVHLVMERAAGTELYESLKVDGKFSQEDALKFMWNLLDTLQYLEERNVVHRDLKPENLILTDPKDKSQFKLLDFGLAMKYEGKDVFDTCGSPGYIAPEILMNRKHGPKVDIYSAGILFYVLLSGYSPFSSLSRSETLKKNCGNDITFGCDWLHIDSKLVRIIRIMTNFNPDLRLPLKDLKVWLRSGHPTFPCNGRRSSEVDAIPGPLGKPKLGEKSLGRDAKAALEAAREYRNAFANKNRRGSMQCDPTV